uniref:Uncharacterized protein n=1 Tax=Oryza nivara TaxID=4536 RepID=A0A0E0G207_ORYNI
MGYNEGRNNAEFYQAWSPHRETSGPPSPPPPPAAAAASLLGDRVSLSLSLSAADAEGSTRGRWAARPFAGGSALRRRRSRSRRRGRSGRRLSGLWLWTDKS